MALVKVRRSRSKEKRHERELATIRASSSPTSKTKQFPPVEESVKTTIQLKNSIYLMGKTRAREKGQSFNSFLSGLIYQECHPAAAHPINVVMPAAPGAMAGLAPLNLPKQRNPLERFGGTYTYKNPDDPSAPKVNVPWGAVYRYDEFLREHAGKQLPDFDGYTNARKLGFPNPDWGPAADQAIDMGEYAEYMKARALAIKRGFEPDDDIPISASIADQEGDEA